MSVKQNTVEAVDESGGEHDLQLFRKTYMRYIALSSFLFGKNPSVYDINEIKSDNEFYESARQIASQLEIDWKTMSHEESNRIMLALLDDFYNEMSKVGNKKDLLIQVTLKVAKHEQRPKRKTKGCAKSD